MTAITGTMTNNIFVGSNDFMQQLLDNKVTIIHHFREQEIQRKRWPNAFFIYGKVQLLVYLCHSKKTYMKYRIEIDTMGEVQVPEDAYYGTQTQRSIDNFKIAQDINK